MRDRKKTILFDFDGVMVNSFEPAFEVSKSLRPWMNFTEDDYRSRFEGNIFEESLKTDKEKVADERFFEIYIPKLFKLPVIPGIPKALAALAENYRLIVISSTISSPIREWLIKHNLAQYFTQIMGADVRKSKIEKIKMIFKKYKIKATDCVFITDTLGDLREAREAGVNSLAVTYGFHSRKVLERGEPAGFIGKPENLPSVVEKYWQKY